MFRLFIDMDGVVADLDGYLYERYGDVIHSEEWKIEFWSKGDHIEMFYELGVTPHKNYLLDFTNYYSDRIKHVSFLTALPHTHTCSRGIMLSKMAWACKYFKNIPIMFGPKSQDKYLHCRGRNDILIDDNLGNIRDWEEEGGDAYWCKNVYDLRRVLDRIEEEIL